MSTGMSHEHPEDQIEGENSGCSVQQITRGLSRVQTRAYAQMAYKKIEHRSLGVTEKFNGQFVKNRGSKSRSHCDRSSYRDHRSC